MKESAIYPGEYIPLPTMENLFAGTTSGAESKTIINMEETDECYILDVPLPATKREDICIFVHDKYLSVIVSKQSSTGVPGRVTEAAESQMLECGLLLPDNADTEFVSAQYSNGVLFLHIPKSVKPISVSDKVIICY